jgi:hypothetical protein
MNYAISDQFPKPCLYPLGSTFRDPQRVIAHPRHSTVPRGLEVRVYWWHGRKMAIFASVRNRECSNKWNRRRWLWMMCNHGCTASNRTSFPVGWCSEGRGMYLGVDGGNYILGVVVHSMFKWGLLYIYLHYQLCLCGYKGNLSLPLFFGLNFGSGGFWDHTLWQLDWVFVELS